MPIESVMPSSHLILCHPFLLLPPLAPRHIHKDGITNNEDQLRLSMAALHLIESPQSWFFFLHAVNVLLYMLFSFFANFSLWENGSSMDIWMERGTYTQWNIIQP